MAHSPYLLSIYDTSPGLQRHDRAGDFTRKQGHLIRSCALHATVIASVMDGTEPEKFNLTPCRSATITAEFKVHARVSDQNIWMPFFSGGHGPLGSPLFHTPWHALWWAFVWMLVQMISGGTFPSVSWYKRFPCCHNRDADLLTLLQ